MNEHSSIEIDETNLTDQTKYRLNDIIKIENYFIKETNQRKSCIKKLSKYVTTFDYINKVLVVLRILTGKRHRQIKLQRLEKVRIWEFELFRRTYALSVGLKIKPLRKCAFHC